MMCRERALSDPRRKEFWLGKAEAYAEQALEEIAFQFKKDNRDTSERVEVNPEN